MPCFHTTAIVVLFFLSELRNMVFYYGDAANLLI